MTFLSEKQRAILAAQPCFPGPKKRGRQINGWHYLRVRIRDEEWEALQKLGAFVGARPMVGHAPGTVKIAVLVRAIACGFIGLVNTRDFKQVVYADRKELQNPWRRFGAAKKNKGAGAPRYRHALAASSW